MRAAIYARVSTDDQTADLQLNELRKYCTAREWQAVEYVDEGVSGRKARRPQLDALWEAVRAGDVDVVVVWRFDRFGRSVKQLITALDEFGQLGVEFVSVREAIDTTTPMGKAMFTIVGAFAELESSIIAERVKAGMSAARERGVHVGRPETIEGTDRQRAVALFREGMGTDEIAEEIGIHVTTVRRIIRRAGYDVRRRTIAA